MRTIHAVFENGVFRPSEPAGLPEGSEVEFEPRIVGPPSDNGDSLARVYEILRRRFDSGDGNVAERHNEHQPWT
jgi:predicted DNA-binding antitoxin AbrB/MazE fold protein